MVMQEEKASTVRDSKQMNVLLLNIRYLFTGSAMDANVEKNN
jgi:hypothetical protein